MVKRKGRPARQGKVMRVSSHFAVGNSRWKSESAGHTVYFLDAPAGTGRQAQRCLICRQANSYWGNFFSASRNSREWTTLRWPRRSTGNRMCSIS